MARKNPNVIHIGAGLGEVAPAGRVLRRPQHPFHLRQKAWQITPFLLAPVLPGETMKNLLLQSRVVTDPIKNSMIGWWIEYFIFYVKHRDMANRSDYESMMLDPNYDISARFSAARIKHYHYGTTINWVDECLITVVDNYFRDEGEGVYTFALDGEPVASINDQSWLDSVINQADLPDQAEVDIVVGVDDKITATEIEGAMRQWEFLRSSNMTNMSYEDFLATYGVRPASVDHHRPELIRFIREWTYPSNTIDPASGAATSACSWAVAERADKNRFFPEPGFIFGVCLARPKVYKQPQLGSAAGLLTDAFSWLPAIMLDDPATSLKLVAQGTGPLPLNTDAGGYVVDVRDIFLYGDQFVNFVLTDTDANLIGLPTIALQKRYPIEADADELFVTPATADLIRQDGIVSLSIAGMQVDATP